MPDGDSRSLQASILGVMDERASTWPDDSRPVFASEVCIVLGLSQYEAKGYGRVTANLRALSQRGLVTRLPGPGTAGWLKGASS